MVSNIWVSVRLRLRRNRATEYWHSLFTDPRSAVLLYHSDDHVITLQQKLRDLRLSNTSYAASVLFFMDGICMGEDSGTLFSHVRTVLEIFILYSIETSDLTWISSDRVSHLSRSVETLSFVGFQESRLPPVPDQPSSMRHCLRVSNHLKLLSRVEQCRADIIQDLVSLSETMCLDGPLSIYDPKNPRHQQNSAAFKKRLKITGYQWVSMAYCLAIDLGGVCDSV